MSAPPDLASLLRTVLERASWPRSILIHTGISLEGGQIIDTQHPVEALSRQDLRLWGHNVRVVQRGCLHIDQTGQHLRVGIEKTGAAGRAKAARNAGG